MEQIWMCISWKIEFYSKKVEGNIGEWPADIIAKFIWISQVIEVFGPDNIGMPHIKSLKKGLFEIRIKAKEGVARALFCTNKGKIIIILNGFIKKTEKTPASELELAYVRMKELLKNE